MNVATYWFDSRFDQVSALEQTYLKENRRPHEWAVHCKGMPSSDLLKRVKQMEGTLFVLGDEAPEGFEALAVFDRITILWCKKFP